MRSRSDSYTISTPIFPAEQLPQANTEIDESNKQPDESISMQSECIDIDNQKEKDDVTEDEKSTTNFENFQPQMKTQLKDLINKQKNEYLEAMKILKIKFEQEQRQLLHNLQNINLTSTPLTNVSIAPTEDEEFTEFQTCLQSASSSEATLTNDHDNEIKEKAATIINKYARGFLVRRLFNTSYVQQCIVNIQNTLEFVLTLKEKSSENLIPLDEKILLYKQLKDDLYRIHNTFFDTSTKEKMKLIASDRKNRRKGLVREERILA